MSIGQITVQSRRVRKRSVMHRNRLKYKAV